MTLEDQIRVLEDARIVQEICAAMTPEGKVKALVKRKMHEHFPDEYRFMPVQNGMGAPGLDFYYCIGGLFVAIETKAPGRQMTDRQDVTSEMIRRAGGLVFMVNGPDTLATAIATIYNRVHSRT